MSDKDNKSDPPEANKTSVQISEPASRKNWFRAWGIPVLLLISLTGSFYWVRFVYETIAGQNWVNMLTVIIVGSQVILLVLWFCFLSYFRRKTVWLTMLVLFLGGAGWASSIRDFNFDGDMNLYLSYRWDPLPEPPQELFASIDQQDDEAAEFVILPVDMPAYRGTRRDGIVEGPVLRTDWQQNPLVELWRTPVGAGYASMSVVGDSLLTIEQREQNEAITCYDTRNGKLRWIHQYPARFFEAMGGLGPRTTPTVSQEVVVSMGAAGDITCLDFKTGKLIWARNLLRELKIPNVVWGMSSSPLIYGNTVCVNPGGPKGNGLMGLNLKDGSTLWKCAGVEQFDDAENKENFCGYSSPMIREIDGVQQIIIFDGHGLSGHDLTSGKQLWHHKYINGARVNCAQPIVLENQKDVFISSSYSMGSALLNIEQTEGSIWKVSEVWHDVKIMRTKFSSPVYYQGYVYGLDEGILMCIDPKTGKKQWKKGRYGHGQVLLTHDQLLIIAEDGDLAIVKADPAKFQELARQKVLPRTSRVWNPHTLVDGIVYVRDHLEMAAFNLRF